MLIPNGHMKPVQIFLDSYKGRLVNKILNGIRITETLQVGLINFSISKDLLDFREINVSFY